MGFGFILDLAYLGLLGVGGYTAWTNKDKIWSDIQNLINLGGHTGGCTKTCSTGQHLDAANCTCVPNTCTKTCPSGQHVDSSCNCVANTGNGGGGTPGSPTSFCAAGDWGSGRVANWKATVATMKALKPAFVIQPGDFEYAGGPAAHKPVNDAIRAFPAKVYGAMGNHDSNADKANFDAYSNAVVNHGNVSIMLLDTDAGSASVSFAKANFSKMTQKWKVVAFHKPIITVKSDHPPDEGKIGALKADFASNGIKLVLQAHNHNYQRFAPVGGVTYTVVGTGGEGAYPIGATCSGCPAVAKTSKSFGTFYCKTSASSMDCKFVANGGSVQDTFSIT